MGIKAKPPRRTREEIKDVIRHAAIEEFAQHGLRGATTQAIAARAGLSKAQLHYYIESKEALYAELLQHVVAEWSRDTFSNPQGDPAEVLAVYVRRKLDFSFEHPALSKMFANELISGGDVLRSVLSPGRNRTADVVHVLRQWIDEGRLRPLDPLLLLMHIWAITQHYADFDVQVRYMQRLGADEPLNREHISEEAVAFVLYGCGLMPRASVSPQGPAVAVAGK